MGWVVGLPMIGAVTLCVAIIMFVGPSSGSSQTRPATPTSGTVVEITTLQVEDEVTVERRFLGRIEARQEASLAFEFGGTIEQISMQEGTHVKQGDVLATMNMDALESQRSSILSIREATQSQVDAANEEVERVRLLTSSGAATANRLVVANAELASLSSKLIQTQSDLNDVELRMSKSRVLAPFDGIVGAPSANLGETVSAGQSIVSLFQDGRADFRVGIPTALRPEDLRNTRILVNDRAYEVRLRTIRPDIDLRTNTRVAVFEVLTSEPVSFGLTATLVAETSVPSQGAWVPMDAMRSNAAGFWIILAVDDDMVARSIAVEVQHLRANEAYVTGAFDTGVPIISKGAHKVVPGQTVVTN